MRRLGIQAGSIIVAAATGAAGQLRIAEWNVTNYGGGRIAAFKSCLYGEFEGRSMAPDVLIGQEFLNQGGVNTFRDLLNSAPGSPGDWKAAPFIDGPDSDSALFYRAGLVELIAVTVVSAGGDPPNHPRNLIRYDLRPVGYHAPGAVVACYSSHMKSGTATADKARRLDEAEAIRSDAASLPAGWAFLVGADLNIQSSSEEAYRTLTDPATGEAGLLHDPIATPGSWHADPAFRFVHTQDPVGGGGMDDRFDQILVSATLVDGSGVDYLGEPDTPYSAVTWQDPLHSYRCWGNDGTSFDAPLTVEGNEMVGPAIAQALRDAGANSGHLPVFLDLKVPARIAAPEVLDFGQVEQGAAASMLLEVSNSGDVSLWSEAGIADLNYELALTLGFAAWPGPFVDAPGGGPNTHTVWIDTALPGVKSGLLTINSDAPDRPQVYVELKGEVIESDGCYADLNRDGTVDLFDFLEFANLFHAGLDVADCTRDATLDLFDFLCFVNEANSGC